jgi:hypothetical protein
MCQEDSASFDFNGIQQDAVIYVAPQKQKSTRAALHVRIKESTPEEEVVLLFETQTEIGPELLYKGHLKRGRGITIARIILSGQDKIILKQTEAHLSVSIVAYEQRNNG